MGCWHSRIAREETALSHCKARKRCMKHFVEARRSFSSSHAMYIRSLHTTASALVQFANKEEEEETITLHHHSPTTSPPQPLPTIRVSDNTLASSSSSLAWEDFWNPFNVPLASTEEMVVTNTVVESRNNDDKVVKDFVQVIKEVHGCFLKAAGAGTNVSLLLEVPTSAFSTPSKASKVYNYGWILNPSLLSRFSIRKLCEKNSGNIGDVNGSHCSTVERLYTLEKKLCQEAKNAETIKMELEKVARLRILEMKKGDNVKMEKTKKEIEKLESQMTIAYHAMETTNAEIIKLRETELYPQLIKLVKGLKSMWRGMHKHHQAQNYIVKQLEDLNNTVPSTNPTSEIHRKSTLQLEVGIQQWHQSFGNLFKAHRDYIQSLTAWLRLNLHHFSRNPLNKSADESKIYTLCEQWNLALDHTPDKVAFKGIKSLLEDIHAIVVQQREEHKQKKKLDAALKELQKKVVQLQSIECNHGPHSMSESSDPKDRVTKKRAKVEHLRAKVEKEKTKHENSIGVTHAMTKKNLQMGFPQAFEGIVRFSSVCVEVFESVYNKANIDEVKHDVKKILPKENRHVSFIQE